MSAFLLGIGFRADMGTCARKLVLLKLIDACEEDGTRIFPAISTIARAAQCSSRQVQRELQAFREAGLIRLVREGGKGPRSTNEYALDLDVLNRLGKEGWATVTNGKGDTVSPLNEDEKGDTGGAERVTPATAKGDKLSHPTPPDPSLDPSVERDARARGSEEEQAEERSEHPGTAAFEKRVMRFCNGRGFVAGPWADWDTSSPGWIAGQFAKLSPDERAEAERWRDPYLLDIADRKKSPMPVGVFLKGKTWTGLDLSILQRAEKARSAVLKPDERAKPDGWAAMLGPVGMAWTMAALLKGPAPDAPEIGTVFLDAQLQRTWPAVWRFNRAQQTRGGLEFAERWHALKPMMEAAPRGSLVLGAWKWTFARRCWPWLSSFDNADAIWLPKVEPPAADAIGPPDLAAAIERALDVFEAAVKADDEDIGNDAGGREAAE